MQEKAAARNPDEYYVAMASSRLRNGKHRKNYKGADDVTHLSADTLKLYGTQDANYIRHKLAVDRAKVERLQSTLHGIHGGKSAAGEVDDDDDDDLGLFFDEEPAKERSAAQAAPPKHIIFVDGPVKKAVRERKRKREEEEEGIDGAEEVATERDPAVEARLQRRLEHAYRELEGRKKRMAELRRTQDAVDLRRNLMQKGPRQKMSGGKDGAPPVYKWKQQRKR